MIKKNNPYYYYNYYFKNKQSKLKYNMEINDKIKCK